MFDNFTKLNVVALTTFVLAKISGIFGITLGFVKEYRLLAAILLIAYFVLLAISILASMKQISIDRNRFSAEDEDKSVIKKLQSEKEELVKQIKELEFKKLELQNFSLRRIR